MDKQGMCRGVWAALEDGRERTLADMTRFNLPAMAVTKWLQTLVVNGYVRMGCRTVDGSPETTFRLTRYSGPVAPHLDEAGIFVDPNLIKRGHRKDIPEKALALTALVHAISRRSGKKRFTTAWMLEQVGQQYARRLPKTFRTLIQRGFLTRGEHDHSFLVIRDNSFYDAVHAAIIEKADKGPFTFLEIAEKLGVAMASRTIGFVMDWVRADGYIVTRHWDHRISNTVYRVSTSKERGEK